MIEATERLRAARQSAEVLTAARLRERLAYDPATGLFTHRSVPVRAGAKTSGLVGKLAGSVSDQGYVMIRVDYRPYRAHRLAWLYVHGVWPENDIDHIDGDRQNNRIANLRDVTRTTNCENRLVASSNSLTGLIGVTVAGSRFVAKIRSDYKTIRLGTFDTAEEAHASYIAAKKLLHKGLAQCSPQ